MGGTESPRIQIPWGLECIREMEIPQFYHQLALTLFYPHFQSSCSPCARSQQWYSGWSVSLFGQKISEDSTLASPTDGRICQTDEWLRAMWSIKSGSGSDPGLDRHVRCI